MRNLLELSQDQKLQFAESLLGSLDQRPFGVTAKAELDGFVFDALVRAEYILDADPLFSVAERLRTTPARINALRYASRLRGGDQAKRLQRLSESIAVVLSSTKGDEIVLNVEDRYWRHMLEAELKGQGVYVDYSFNRERLVLKGDEATHGLFQVFGSAGERLEAELQEARAEDEQRRRGDAFAKLAKKAGAGVLGVLVTQAAGAVPLNVMLQGGQA